MPDNLEAIKRALTSKVGSPALFSLINTRVILRTGIDLANITPVQANSPESIEKVLGCLKAMGYTF